MQPFDLNSARMLLDFSGGDPQMEALGRLQLEGAVALQNMLVNPEVGMGYLADEVGMGKTYLALGVVAMMRYFNPGYRVLYICPSRNVQEKWYGRELPNFIKTNVLTRNFRVRTPQGESGTPSMSCSSIDELIHAATTGYYGDIFVRMSSFSMAMGEDDEGLEKHLRQLREHVPASVLGKVRRSKEGIKKAYARALNYLLPTFDLVVIDEAHNFKHPFESSARNLALSRILGFNNEETGEAYPRRVRSALLLSATPFDVNPAHLYNQLNLVGKAHLMPDQEQWQDKGRLRDAMARFMVRRLNELLIQGERHTRNMYRREWRKGKKAEIGFKSDEHKLITALVQKHIGDVLNREGGNPSFQLGLLASFESYAQTTRSGPVEFDGEKSPETASDARDRHLIAVIRDSYVEEGFGKSLPHPKMDQVSREAAGLALDKGRKQLIFVRRVKSVSEIKQKLDDEYDDWMRRHIDKVLADHTDQLRSMHQVWAKYHEVRKRRDDDISGGEADTTTDDDEEERLPPKNDTIFSWFFRGQLPAVLADKPLKLSSWSVPENIKSSLTARNNANVLLFEFNWAAWVAQSLFGVSLDELIERLGELRVREVLASAPGVAKDDWLSPFLSIQRAFLEEVSRQTPEMPGLAELAVYLRPLIREGNYRPTDSMQPLSLHTLFSHFQDRNLACRYFGSSELLAQSIKGGGRNLYDRIHRVEIHRQLVALSFRSGHPFIDLYLARLSLGESELNEARRQEWLRTLCRILEEQHPCEGFSTARELSLLNDNLELVIKNNLPGVYSRTQDELRLWLNRQLPSSAPIVGANGETSGNRSVQARKFRMPGYPLILVSTDVFQEGEDLHTFCDSVIHYGLSSSPVSIEQKTGRVDRVGACAHRRLLSLEHGRAVSDDDFIQVSFPFVKQSIEAVQVRALCNNLNLFLASLHEIGGEGMSMDEFVDTSVELVNRNEIPDQLLELLASPYAAPVSRQSNPQLERGIRRDTQERAEAVKHVEAMLKVVGIKEKPGKRFQVHIPGLKHRDFDVRLDSARSCGEMLLRVTAVDAVKVISPGELTRAWILEEQGRLYRETLYRTYAIRIKDGYELCRDAEMLVAGPGITHEADIAGLFKRFSQGVDEADEPVLLKDRVPEIDETKVNAYLMSGFHWNGIFSVRRRVNSLELIFKFDDDRRRRHCIRVSDRDGCCYFEAKVASADRVRGFSRDKLLKCTWLRNRNVDLVGFMVRPDGCLIARALHPAPSMGFEEFIFTAYVLV